MKLLRVQQVEQPQRRQDDLEQMPGDVAQLTVQRSEVDGLQSLMHHGGR
ncbi:MAG TPA: hypothetical protein VIY28_04330 [Pseudonocardiaceae bacterium]